jgi:hypothetical protein
MINIASRRLIPFLESFIVFPVLFSNNRYPMDYAGKLGNFEDQSFN